MHYWPLHFHFGVCLYVCVCVCAFEWFWVFVWRCGSERENGVDYIVFTMGNKIKLNCFCCRCTLAAATYWINTLNSVFVCVCMSIVIWKYFNYNMKAVIFAKPWFTILMITIAIVIITKRLLFWCHNILLHANTCTDTHRNTLLMLAICEQ